MEKNEEIFFSPHANLKVGQRKISRQLVIFTIKNPDFENPSYGLRKEIYRKWGKNFLKVVITKKDNLTTVITAHWVANVKKQ